METEASEFILYTASFEAIQINVLLENDDTHKKPLHTSLV